MNKAYKYITISKIYFFFSEKEKRNPRDITETGIKFIITRHTKLIEKAYRIQYYN